MFRPAFLALLLLGLPLCLAAQEGYPGLDRWQAPSGPSTVEGCLRSIATDYSVVAGDGTVTRLTGNTARLSRYVGHEVGIGGKPSLITLDTSVTRAASTVEELPALEVKTAKEISPTCGSAP